MTIYTPRINYRKIYEQHHGPIPPGLEIHHIDGDYTNNNPANLIAVTIQEHYNIHYAQEDWDACSAIAIRMNIDRTEISRKRVENGTHNFLGGKIQSESHRRRVANGTHQFLVNHPSKIKVTCPHCDKIGDKPNMMKYHFDKCKSIT
jgi:hypothetical protein